MAKKTEVEKRSFEDIIKEINEIVEGLERGNLEIEESLVHYSKGADSIAEARKILSDAKARLETLMSEKGGELVIADSATESFLKD